MKRKLSLHKAKALLDRSRRGDFLDGAHSADGPMKDGDAALIIRYLRSPNFYGWLLVRDMEVLPGYTLEEMVNRSKLKRGQRFPGADDLSMSLTRELRDYRLTVYNEFRAMVDHKRKLSALYDKLEGNADVITGTNVHAFTPRKLGT